MGLIKFTPEQQQIREMVRQMARTKIADRAAEIDEKGEYPEDIHDLLRESGLLALPFPREYGGEAAGMVTACMVVEELGKVCFNSAYICALPYIHMGPILSSGNDRQKQTYLTKMATGEWRSAFACSEPDAGSDVGAMRTTAVKDGNEYVISGSKCFITNSPKADFLIVFAKTDPTKGLRGISTFIVEKDRPGWGIGRIEKKMGGKGMPSAELWFDGCRIPQENLLGIEGQGFITAMKTFNRSRPLIGARALGLAQGALDYVVQYAAHRKAFGHPISEFEGLQFMIADMAIGIEASRLLIYEGATVVDEGKVGKETAALMAMSKCFSTDVAMKTAVDAVQILGGYGVMKDYPMERFMRDAKLLQIVEGTNQVQRSIIARALFEGV